MQAQDRKQSPVYVYNPLLACTCMMNVCVHFFSVSVNNGILVDKCRRYVHVYSLYVPVSFLSTCMMYAYRWPLMIDPQMQFSNARRRFGSLIVVISTLLCSYDVDVD